MGEVPSAVSTTRRANEAPPVWYARHAPLLLLALALLLLVLAVLVLASAAGTVARLDPDPAAVTGRRHPAAGGSAPSASWPSVAGGKASPTTAG
jgi:hypothetical protein